MNKNVQHNHLPKLGPKAGQKAVPSAGVEGLSPDELKALIRDGLVSMSIAERGAFFETLEAETRSLGLNIRGYLVPLGIPGRSPDDLTPTEVGHLVRYLKINVPKSVPGIQKAISRFTAFAEKIGHAGGRLAA
jgi:hypothetical protein